MNQLRIEYDLGFDENGRRQTRRQTLPLLNDATIDAINNFLDKLEAVISYPIYSAVKVTYENVR